MWNDRGFEVESMKWIMVCDDDEWSDRCHRVTHISTKGFVTLFGQLVRNAFLLLWLLGLLVQNRPTEGKKHMIDVDIPVVRWHPLKTNNASTCLPLFYGLAGANRD